MGVSILTKNPVVRKQYLLVFVDSLIVMASLVGLYLPWFHFSLAEMSGAFMNWLFLPLIAIVLVHLGAFYVLDLYNIKTVSPTYGRLIRLIIAVLLAVGVIILVLFFLHKYPNLRKVLVTHVPLLIGMMYLWREIFYRVIARSHHKLHVLLIGADRLNCAILEELGDHSILDYRVACLVAGPDDESSCIEEMKRLGVDAVVGDPSLPELIPQRGIDVVVFSLRSMKLYNKKLLYIKSRGVHLFDALTFYSLITGRVPIADTDDSALAILTERFPLSGYYRNVKRIVDIGLSLIGIIISSPFVILSALLIALESRGPVFFRPERVGEHGRPLRLFKLRTMHTGKKGSLFTQLDDPRVTAVGRLVRKFGFDEFPQLFNVLRGDLSLIGPRPIEQVFVDKYAEMTPLYYLRLSVKPGISGWAQVNQVEYPNDDESQLVKLEYDLFYVSHVSLLLDVIIIFKTLKKFFHLGYDRREAGKAARPVMAARQEQ